MKAFGSLQYALNIHVHVYGQSKDILPFKITKTLLMILVEKRMVFYLGKLL